LITNKTLILTLMH